KYRLISENSGDVIWIMDIGSQKFTYVSPSVYKLRGYTVEEVLNQSMENVLTPESYQSITENLPGAIQAFLLGEDSAILQTNRVDQTCKDGSIVHTEVVTSLLTDEDKNVMGILGVSRDITKRVEMEEELKNHFRKRKCYLKKFITGLRIIL
ncbi:PAS domain S-box protein, partial [uncultured Methanobacterium sp.]|uniref:PAS domain S-box protein n=1 Tax=uncultured Methanobacterium sp. TaxID=176306 RepID=UPI002AA7B574